ncbi:MAG: hypothetical protein J2P17_06530 [Mycobacterium sp.]|nr:hypothetical protein [Mycobacterium sp.]
MATVRVGSESLSAVAMSLTGANRPRDGAIAVAIPPASGVGSGLPIPPTTPVYEANEGAEHGFY